MSLIARAVNAFENDGFVVLPGLVSDSECDELAGAMDGETRSRPGRRGVLSFDCVGRTAQALQRQPALRELMGDRLRAVHCTLFAKGAMAQWSVTLHQDLSIPVRERVEIAGWSGWARKEGTWFVQPPEPILRQLVAVRLQLDGDAELTGPLEVVRGTHALGRLDSESIRALPSHARLKCSVPRGGALVMRPLLVHASGKPISTRPRRVLHYLFGPPLPPGLDWPVPVLADN